MTKHYKQALIPGGQIPNVGQFMIYENGIWYLKRNNEVARLPEYLRRSLLGQHLRTEVFGPYTFYNFFERTKEAKYLMDMFKYKHLTPAPVRKIKDILNSYTDWIDLNESFIDTLLEREGCEDVWRNTNDNRNTSEG